MRTDTSYSGPLCKSSAQGSDCVEVAELPGGGRAVRDSKYPDGPRLEFTPSEWDAFLDRVRGGEFD
jgi:hypothetical protein